jgi:hypothetical protein
MRLAHLLHPSRASEWLFPADSASGHLVEHKEDRATLTKWGNDLRQTYRTIAQTVGVADLDIHLLMNHSIAGVNAGYVNRNKLLRDHLRQQQEMISQKVIEAARSRAKDKGPKPMIWPHLSARSILREILLSTETGERRTWVPHDQIAFTHRQITPLGPS